MLKGMKLGASTAFVVIIILKFWGGYVPIYITESLRQPPNELISLNYFLFILGVIQALNVIEYFREEVFN